MISHVNTGLYILGPGETVQEVSKKVYNDVHRYQALLKANPDCRWEVGDIIKVNNVRGRTTVVLDGETTAELISRVYKGHMVHQFIDKYLLWNGGKLAEELVGTEVFIPER
jgi:hypothetical protein